MDANQLITACVSCCQTVMATGGSGETLKTILSVLAVPLSVLTFWLGYRQREYERRRSYYQDVVIDVMLPDIIDTFDLISEELTNAGRDGLAGISSNRKSMPRSCSIALSKFADTIFKLQDRIVQRVAIFDEPLVDKVRNAFQEIQDDLTGWFEDVGLHKRRDTIEIDPLLKKHQRILIRMLYQCKMRSF